MQAVYDDDCIDVSTVLCISGLKNVKMINQEKLICMIQNEVDNL